MTNVRDRHIEEEIVPLFNFTYNDHAKEIVRQILTHPLSSKGEIDNRQQLLKGFIANHNIISNYSYSRLDLLEVYAFLQGSNSEVSNKGLRWTFFLSETKRHEISRKFVQTVLIFHRLNNHYFKRIETKVFPERSPAIMFGLSHPTGRLKPAGKKLLIIERTMV